MKNFLTAKAHKLGVPKPTIRPQAKGIDRSRKIGLVKKLCEMIPKSRLKFWQDLPETTVPNAETESDS